MAIRHRRARYGSPYVQPRSTFAPLALQAIASRVRSGRERTIAPRRRPLGGGSHQNGRAGLISQASAVGTIATRTHRVTNTGARTDQWTPDDSPSVPPRAPRRDPRGSRPSLVPRGGQLAASDVTPRLRQLAPRAPRRPRGPGHRRRRGAGSDGAARRRTPRRAAPYPRAAITSSASSRRPTSRSTPMGTGSSGWLSIHCRAAPRLARHGQSSRPGQDLRRRARRRSMKSSKASPTSRSTADAAPDEHASREDQRQRQDGRRRGREKASGTAIPAPSCAPRTRPHLDVADTPNAPCVSIRSAARRADRAAAPPVAASRIDLPQQVAAAQRDLA